MHGKKDGSSRRVSKAKWWFDEVANKIQVLNAIGHLKDQGTDLINVIDVQLSKKDTSKVKVSEVNYVLYNVVTLNFIDMRLVYCRSVKSMYF